MRTEHRCVACGGGLTRNGAGRVFRCANPECGLCGEDVAAWLAEERYFPDDPGNKVFAVDVYVTVAKCVKVEAADKDAAVKMAADQVSGMASGLTDREFLCRLADDGFQCEDGVETMAAGEAGEDGDIKYY